MSCVRCQAGFSHVTFRAASLLPAFGSEFPVGVPAPSFPAAPAELPLAGEPSLPDARGVRHIAECNAVHS